MGTDWGVKAWSLVNFISEHEYGHLAAKMEIARELQPSLQELFEKNGTSPEFLQNGADIRIVLER